MNSKSAARRLLEVLAEPLFHCCSDTQLVVTLHHAAGEPTIAEALVGAVSKIALMARILPNQQQLQQVRWR